MEIDIKYSILFYLLILYLLYLSKPHLFKFDDSNQGLRRRKFILLMAMMIIIAIISMYIKIFFEWI
jgi:hypothetical protein